jgi:class 3 adenylate cyclase
VKGKDSTDWALAEGGLLVSTQPTSDFGTLLRRHRRAAGLTQEELAERAGVSVDAISALERGVSRAPHKDTVALLAEALKLSAQQRAVFETASRRSPTTSPILALSGTPAVNTFLFTDISGYTRFTQEQGDEAAARLIVRYVGILRPTVEAGGGRLVGLHGDGALVVFASARRALQTALELQARFAQATQLDATLPLVVGMGLDAGESMPVEGTYLGRSVNLAAILCGLAGPGEILASEAVVHLAHKLDGVVYRERGITKVKGLSDPIALIQVLPLAP